MTAITARGRSTPGAEIVPIRAFVDREDPEWDALALDASEPNVFAERWFVSAGVRWLVSDDVQMLAIRDDRGLIGLMPIRTMPRYGRMPVTHVENWLHYNAFLGTPLVRRGDETAFWEAALGALDRSAAARAFLHIVGLVADGALTTAILTARSGAAIVHRSSRALLASDLDAHAYYEATVRKKKRKELGRLQSRLRELGQVRTRRFAPGDLLEDWIGAFLGLEASGWKGRDGGAALANDRATEAFLRAVLLGAERAGRLEMLSLELDERPIAMLVNFLASPGSFSFKIAYDEEFARYSPGVLIQIENLKVLDRPGIDWMDSCASEDHPMINSLWRERRQLVRVTVPLKGVRRRALFSACRTAERGSAWLRTIRA